MYVQKIPLSFGETFEAVKTVNRIFIVDASYSMCSDLPAIRKSLKDKIPSLTNDGDTVSLIQFSGRGQVKVLVDGAEIRSLKDFSELFKSIDKLGPIGATGFVDPFVCAKTLASSLKERFPQNNNHVLFQTDGYDNSWSNKQIIDAAIDLSTVIDTMTIVEYGYYANRKLLTEIAEQIGANLIFSESFSQFSNVIESNLTSVLKGGKKIKVELPEAPLFGFAFGYENDELYSFVAEGNTVTVPESFTGVSFISAQELVCDDDAMTLQAIYALSQRMKNKEVRHMLSQIGDVRLIKKFMNCFTKQDWSEFQAMVKEMIVDPTKRYLEGQDKNLVPKDDAFCVVDLIELLDQPGNKFYPYGHGFEYEAIGAKRVDSNDVVKESDREEILKKISEAKTKEDLEAANAELAALLESKQKLEFVRDESQSGYKIDGVVYNENRANISIRVKVNGTVDVSKIIPGINSVNTHIYRNYTLVKDGIKHTSCKNLPFSLTKETFDTLQANGLLEGETYQEDKVYNINADIPVVNMKMISEISAEKYFKNVIKLQELKSEQKVYNSFQKANFEKTYKGIVEAYGEDNASLLKEAGITDNGFAPKTVKGETSDEYMARFFECKIASCSSIPPVNDALITKILAVQAGTAKKPLTLSESLLESAVLECLAKKSGQPGLLVESDNSDKFKEWLETKIKETKAKVKQLSAKCIKDMFAITAGQTWFKEFESMEENSMELEVSGRKFKVSATLTEKSIAI